MYECTFHHHWYDNRDLSLSLVTFYLFSCFCRIFRRNWYTTTWWEWVYKYPFMHKLYWIRVKGSKGHNCNMDNIQKTCLNSDSVSFTWKGMNPYLPFIFPISRYFIQNASSLACCGGWQRKKSGWVSTWEITLPLLTTSVVDFIFFLIDLCWAHNL